jgi:hypothetical protein
LHHDFLGRQLKVFLLETPAVKPFDEGRVEPLEWDQLDLDNLLNVM